jgi:hypothetical protein
MAAQQLSRPLWNQRQSSPFPSHFEHGVLASPWIHTLAHRQWSKSRQPCSGWSGGRPPYDRSDLFFTAVCAILLCRVPKPRRVLEQAGAGNAIGRRECSGSRRETEHCLRWRKGIRARRSGLNEISFLLICRREQIPTGRGQISDF